MAKKKNIEIPVIEEIQVSVVYAEARNEAGTDVLAKLSDGSFVALKSSDQILDRVVVTPYVISLEQMPPISSAQLRMWLLDEFDIEENDILSAIDELPSKEAKMAKIEFEYNQTFVPTCASIKVIMAKCLNLDEAELKAGWKRAGSY